MKKKVLVSSILTIAMCLSIIAGSTFAIFTSQSQVDVSITSANVKVSATILNETLATYSMGNQQVTGKFENGGTAAFDAETSVLTLDKVTPGDMVKFDIRVFNHSDVTIQYRVKWSIEGKLAEVLEATADGEALVEGSTEWAKWTPDEAESKTINVIAHLPVEVGNEYQNATANIHFTVEAVQGNAVVTEAKTEDQLLTMLSLGGTVKLANDIALDAGTTLTVPTGIVSVLDLNGKTLTGTSHKSVGAVINNKGTLSITGGTIKSTAADGGSAIMNNGTLTVNDATLNGAPHSGDGNSWPSYTVNNVGTATLNNCEVTSVHGGLCSYNDGAVLTLNNTNLDMSGIPGFTSHGMYTYNNGNIVVNGGSFINRAADQATSGGSVINGNVTVFEGTFTGRIENYYGTPKLYGGTYSVAPNAAWVADSNFEVKEDANNGTWSVVPKEGVTAVTTPDALQDALEASGAAASGDTAVFLKGDIDLNGTDWTPIYIDGYNGAGIVTVYGNGNTIYGLNAPLFKGGFAGNSGIIIKDLTIADSNIVSESGLGGGAFIDCADSMHVVTVENCHVVNSTIEGERTGGIIGWCSGYAQLNDGPVKAYVTVKDCSVVDCEIIGAGSAGGIAGHPGASDYTYTTIENCAVKNTTIHSNDDGGWRVGSVVGTANNGHVVINNVDVEDVKLSQINKGERDGEACLYGRFVPSGTGTLEIDGTHYVASEAQLAQLLTSDNESINILLVNDIKIPINTLGTMTPGSGEYKLGGENTQSINVDLGGHELKVSTDYWSILGAKNADATMTFKNGSMTSTQASGTWNSYDLCFANCNIVLEDVVFDKAIALESAGKEISLKNVTVKESHDYYAIWIPAAGQTVNIDGLTVDSGRGIKIDDQYVDTSAKVTLNVSNATFVTNNKAAILVKTPDGADITLSNVSISGCIKDDVNAVWIDSDAPGIPVTVVGGTCIDEP